MLTFMLTSYLHAPCSVRLHFGSFFKCWLKYCLDLYRPTFRFWTVLKLDRNFDMRFAQLDHWSACFRCNVILPADLSWLDRLSLPSFAFMKFLFRSFRLNESASLIVIGFRFGTVQRDSMDSVYRVGKINDFLKHGYFKLLCHWHY